MFSAKALWSFITIFIWALLMLDYFSSGLGGLLVGLLLRGLLVGLLVRGLLVGLLVRGLLVGLLLRGLLVGLLLRGLLVGLLLGGLLVGVLGAFLGWLLGALWGCFSAVSGFLGLLLSGFGGLRLGLLLGGLLVGGLRRSEQHKKRPSSLDSVCSSCCWARLLGRLFACSRTTALLRWLPPAAASLGVDLGQESAKGSLGRHWGLSKIGSFIGYL